MKEMASGTGDKVPDDATPKTSRPKKSGAKGASPKTPRTPKTAGAKAAGAKAAGAKNAGAAASGSATAAPEMPSFEALARTDAAGLDAGDCLGAAGECAKAMAFFQARQTEFLAAFGHYRTDPKTAYDEDLPAKPATADTAANTGEKQAADSEKATDSTTTDNKPADSKPDGSKAAAKTVDATATEDTPVAKRESTEPGKPANAKSAGQKLAEAKAAADEAARAKNDTDKTAGDKPASDKPASDKPAGDVAGDAKVAAQAAAMREVLASQLISWAGDEVACELDVAGITGTTQLLDSLMTVTCLPQVLTALKAGRLSARRFRKVIEATRDLPADLAGDLDTEIAGWDMRITFGTFCRRINRWLLTRQAALAEKNVERTARDRSVQFSPGRNGSAWLSVFGPADRVRSLFNQIDAAARTHDGSQETDYGEPDKRTLDQLRFDLLTATRIPTQGGQAVATSRYRVSVTVPFVTLLGAHLPGEIAGYGPIPAGMARRIAAGTTWIERILTDPVTGRPIDADRHRYRLSARMRQYIHTRDRECTLPSCNKPADVCEIDHIEPWIDGRIGGLSDMTNLHPACKAHHQAKTNKKFSVEVRPHNTHTPQTIGKTGMPRPPDRPRRSASPGRPGTSGRPDSRQGPGSSRWRTSPRLIRWTLPTGRHYDVLDDCDPTAARLETDTLKQLGTRKPVCPPDHAPLHYHANQHRRDRRTLG